MQRQRFTRHSLLLAAMMGLLVAGAAGQSKVGTTAATFLTIPVGGRATAMGGAFTAVANDATCLFYNVAGLSRLAQNEVSVSHAKWLTGTNLNWLGVAVKIDESNAVGLSFDQLDYGEEEITTAASPAGTGQYWDAMDLAIGLSYARSLTDRFSAGGTARYIHQRIWNESATAVGFDVGLLYTTEFHDLKLGMNISNFGTEMQMEGKDLYQTADIDVDNAGNNATILSSLGTKSWTLPLVFTVGLAGSIIHSDEFEWIIASDASYPNSQTPYLNLGTEVTWNDMVAVRLGKNSLFKQDAEEEFGAGVGIKYAIGPTVTKFDFGYMSYKRFDGVTRLTLAVEF